MICPKCGTSNDFGREMCYNCGSALTEDDPFAEYRKDDQEEMKPQISRAPQIDGANEELIGYLKKAYITATGEYYSLFFFPSSILSVNHGKAFGSHLDTTIIRMLKVHESGKKVDAIETKLDVVKKFSNYIDYKKNYIVNVKLIKRLTDAAITIELPPSKGFFGQKRINISFGFSKKEFENLNKILTKHYSDKLVK